VTFLRINDLSWTRFFWFYFSVMKMGWNTVRSSITSLKANGNPRTPAPINDIKMLAKIFRGLLVPGPAAGAPAVIFSVKI